MLTYNQKILISLLSSALWIYYRTSDCYNLIPRKNLLSVILVTSWTYLNYKEPLALPIGLLILYLFKGK